MSVTAILRFVKRKCKLLHVLLFYLIVSAFRYIRNDQIAGYDKRFEQPQSKQEFHFTIEELGDSSMEKIFRYVPDSDKVPNEYKHTQLFSPPDCFNSSCVCVVPSFIIIGAQKSGTTSLFEYLHLNPQVLPLNDHSFAGGHKELGFFDNTKRSAAGLPGLLSQFMTIDDILKSGRQLNKRYITGEATPSYITSAIAPNNLKKIIPNAKLIVLLRNPVDRAYSQYQHCRRIDTEDGGNGKYTGGLSFDEIVDRELQMIATCKHHIRKWPDFELCHHRQAVKLAAEIGLQKKPNRNYNVWAFQPIMRGMYYAQLAHYVRKGFRNNMLIVQSEDLYANTVEVLQRIENYLGLDAHNWQSEDVNGVYNFGKKTRVFKTKDPLKYEEMNPETRARLESFYKAFNEKLYLMFDAFPEW